MITLKTNNLIAVDSDDHIHPDGVYNDNNCNPWFIPQIESYFNRKINVLDLGCAGAEFVSQMIDRGHIAVGIDGSDRCLNIDQEILQKYGKMPVGYKNWQQHGNKNLFTCDLSYDYELTLNDELLQFDLITCFDVMEHLYEERIDKFCEMVVKHLKQDGIFFAGIAMFSHAGDHGLGHTEWHKSLFTKEKWNSILSKYFKQVMFPASVTYRDQNVYYVSNDQLYFAAKKL